MKNLRFSRNRILSFLLDVRVLGVLGQITFVILFFLAIFALQGNVSENFSKAFGGTQLKCNNSSANEVRCLFDFMATQASFDIGETLIKYDVTDTYWKALYIGLLNTLQVAVSGIALTIILGILVGITLLSQNWLLRTLAKVYVELMRNIPLVVVLVFLYFFILEALPPIAESTRLGTANLSAYFTQRGLYIPAFVPMPSATWFWASLILGIAIWVYVFWRFDRQRRETGKSPNFWLYGGVPFLVLLVAGWLLSSMQTSSQAMIVAPESGITSVSDLAKLATPDAPVSFCAERNSNSQENFRAILRKNDIPYTITTTRLLSRSVRAVQNGDCVAAVGERSALLAAQTEEGASTLQLVALPESPIAYVTPIARGDDMDGGNKLSPEFAAILFGLVLYTSAYVAEIVRSGILSVSKGQTEAARALGLTEGQRLSLVVLPQAMRVIIPPLTSQCLNLAKNSTLATFVGYPDFFNVALTSINQSGRSIQLVAIIMMAYLTISLVTSSLLNIVNERMKLVER
jgi:general L-amino acid transport system permease protein